MWNDGVCFALIQLLCRLLCVVDLPHQVIVPVLVVQASFCAGRGDDLTGCPIFREISGKRNVFQDIIRHKAMFPP